MSGRRTMRWLGTVMVLTGVCLLAWCLLVWRWQDPFTAVYTYWQQRELADEYSERLADYRPPKPVPVRTASAGPTAAQFRLSIARAARRYRGTLGEGDAIGRLKIPRLDLNAIMVNGTDDDTLKMGPARHLRTFMPGEGKLIYVAGHRTTYSAPFSEINDLKLGDRVMVELPYATFEYRIRDHRIVDDNALEVLRSRGREELALQACHPRFFASQRYIAYAIPVRVTARGGHSFAYRGTELSAAPAPPLSQ